MNLGETFRGAHTPIYASPQQKRGQDANVRDDVYALGIIGYQMLVADLGAERPSRMWRKPLVGCGLSDSMLDLLESCWEDDPAERPADGLELAVALTRQMDLPPAKEKQADNRKPAKPMVHPDVVTDSVQPTTLTTSPTKPRRVVADTDSIAELIEAGQFEEALATFHRLPKEGRPLALLKKLHVRWQDDTHALARQAAESRSDFAGAVTLLEKLPEMLRDGKIIADYRTKRDRVAELLKCIHEDAENPSNTPRLRARVTEYRQLNPYDPVINALCETLGPPPSLPKAFTNSIGMKFVRVSAGPFWMGDRGSQKKVFVPQDFYIGVYPATQGQYEAIMDCNPSAFGPKGNWNYYVEHISHAKLKYFPVENVFLDDTKRFIEKLNESDKQNGFVYRLPTEIEWEYACRGGANDQQECAYDFYSTSWSLFRTLPLRSNEFKFGQGNFLYRYYSTPDGERLGFSDSKYGNTTTKVGSYRPNGLGLHDMHGNVWEWCENLGPGGTGLALRGGSYQDEASYCRASSRLDAHPKLIDFRYYTCTGFRVVAIPLDK